MTFRTEVIWETSDTAGNLKEGKSFANYDGIVYQETDGNSPDLFTIEPIERLREAIGRILILNNTQFQRNTTQTQPAKIFGVVSSPIHGTQFKSTMTVAYYRWATELTAVEGSMVAPPVPPSSTNLSDWFTTAPSEPVLANGGLALFRSDVVLIGGSVISSSTPTQQGATVYKTTGTRYLWVADTSISSPNPVATPATPIDATLSQWVTIQPTQPVIMSGAQALFISTVETRNGAIVSATTPTQQGATVYITTQLRYREAANAAAMPIIPLGTRVPSQDFDTLIAAGDNDPIGIFADDTHLWVTDHEDNKIYAYNKTTKARAPSQDFNTLQAVDDSRPLGIFADETYMWVVIGGKIYAYNKATKARVPSQDFNTLQAAGNGHPLGIFADETHMWVVDNADDRVYAYNKTTKTRVPSQDFSTISTTGSSISNIRPTGIWSNDIYIWVAGTSSSSLADNRKIFAYDKSTKARVPLRDFNILNIAGNTSPRDIWSDGTYMWVVDVVDDKIYAYSLSGAINAPATSAIPIATKVEVPSQNFSLHVLPNGLWSDGTHIWVVGEHTGEIFAYNLSTKARVPTQDFNTLSAAGNTRPRGLWSDGTYMWVADSTDGKIYAYNLSTKVRVPSQDFNTLNTAGNTNPRGIWSDGTYIWVIDATDGKIYTYNLSTKARVPTQDFNTLSAAGNTRPRGLWSDGTYMWVTNPLGSPSKIYAYNLSTKARVSEQDFNTLSAAGNNYPEDIWSDGTYMWVSDNINSRAYAYSLGEVIYPAVQTPDTPAMSDTDWVTTEPEITVPVAGSVAVFSSTITYNGTIPIAATQPVLVGSQRNANNGVSYNGVFQVTNGPATATGEYGNSATGLICFSEDNTLSGISPTALGAGITYRLRQIIAGGVVVSANADLGLESSTHTLTLNQGAQYQTCIKLGTTSQFEIAFGATHSGGAGGFGWVFERKSGTSPLKARVPSQDFNTLQAAGNTSPSNIWSNNTHMWVADTADNKLYAYLLSTKARVSSQDFNTLLAAGNTDPRGFWSDGTHMWIADSTDDKIYAYNLSTKVRVPSQDFNTLSAAGNNRPRGIWSDDTHMWVADAVDNKIYAYLLSTKARVSSQDFDTLNAAGNTDSTGIWSDGTHMWVADVVDDKIYAYNLSTKARVPSKDFNTLSGSGNTDPVGIWSDDTYMWVMDFGDRRIYAYDV